jgi:hypothetical protein
VKCNAIKLTLFFMCCMLCIFSVDVIDNWMKTGRTAMGRIKLALMKSGSAHKKFRGRRLWQYKNLWFLYDHIDSKTACEETANVSISLQPLYNMFYCNFIAISGKYMPPLDILHLV